MSLWVLNLPQCSQWTHIHTVCPFTFGRFFSAHGSKLCGWWIVYRSFSVKSFLNLNSVGINCTPHWGRSVSKTESGSLSGYFTRGVSRKTLLCEHPWWRGGGFKVIFKMASFSYPLPRIPFGLKHFWELWLGKHFAGVLRIFNSGLEIKI